MTPPQSKPRARPPAGKGGKAPSANKRKATAPYLENAALYYLGRYAASSAHLRRVLMAKVERSARAHGTDRGEGAAMVEALIVRFLRSGLLDDESYAKARAHTLHRGGASARVIRGKLAAKGVPPRLVEKALRSLHEEVFEAELAAAVTFARRRRLGPFRGKSGRLSDEDARKRAGRELAAMARAGFSYDLSRKVVEAADARELEERFREPEV